MMSDAPALSLKDVTIAHGAAVVLRDINLELARGETLAVLAAMASARRRWLNPVQSRAEH